MTVLQDPKGLWSHWFFHLYLEFLPRNAPWAIFLLSTIVYISANTVQMMALRKLLLLCLNALARDSCTVIYTMGYNTLIKWGDEKGSRNEVSPIHMVAVSFESDCIDRQNNSVCLPSAFTQYSWHIDIPPPKCRILLVKRKNTFSKQAVSMLTASHRHVD